MIPFKIKICYVQWFLQEKYEHLDKDTMSKTKFPYVENNNGLP